MRTTLVLVAAVLLLAVAFLAFLCGALVLVREFRDDWRSRRKVLTEDEVIEALRPLATVHRNGANRERD